MLTGAGLEEVHELQEGFSLRSEFFRCARELFRGSGVALSNQVHLAHGFIDLAYAGRLLA